MTPRRRLWLLANNINCCIVCFVQCLNAIVLFKCQIILFRLLGFDPSVSPFSFHFNKCVNTSRGSIKKKPSWINQVLMKKTVWLTAFVHSDLLQPLHFQLLTKNKATFCELRDVLPGDVKPPPTKPFNARCRQRPGENASDLFHSAPRLRLPRDFLSSGDDYELRRLWHSAATAAQAITCCDRDTEASFSLQEADWLASQQEGKRPWQWAVKDKRAQDTFAPPSHIQLCRTRTLRLAKRIAAALRRSENRHLLEKLEHENPFRCV